MKMKKILIIVVIILITIVAAFIILADDVMDAVIETPDGSILDLEELDLYLSDKGSAGFIETDFMIRFNRRLLSDQMTIVEIDPENMRIGSLIDGKWHVLVESISRTILSDSVFDDYFIQRKPPELSCSINGDSKFPIAESMEWTFTLPDGNIRTKVEDSNAVEFWSLPEKSRMELTFNLNPDTLVVVDSSGVEMDVSGGVFNIPDVEDQLEYSIIATWNQPGYEGKMIYRFIAIVDLPIKTRIVGTDIKPGEFFSLVVENSEVDGDLLLEQPFVNKVEYYESGSSKWYIIPINYWTEAGDYTLNVKWVGSETDFDIPIEIKSKKFDIQYLYVDEEIEQSTRSDEAYEEFALYMNPARETSQNEPLFDGVFLQPVEGRISTEFGMYRYVNDSMTSYRHSGIDIAIDRGTPIQATNNGVVALSQKLILTGNTIVIDHGLGIFSVYFHMDSLSVEKGERVEKGEIIGAVGSTGFSTGPHLHWTMSYYKTNLDPYQFMETEILQ
jgi:murein DD-endopeptidase MepM/ murein hydrolase activator NlpD